MIFHHLIEEDFYIHILLSYTLFKRCQLFQLALVHVGIVDSILLLPYGYWAGDRNYTDGDDENVVIRTPAIKIGSNVYHGFNVSVLFIIVYCFLCCCHGNVSK